MSRIQSKLFSIILIAASAPLFAQKTNTYADFAAHYADAKSILMGTFDNPAAFAKATVTAFAAKGDVVVQPAGYVINDARMFEFGIYQVVAQIPRRGTPDDVAKYRRLYTDLAWMSKALLANTGAGQQTVSPAFLRATWVPPAKPGH